MASLRHAYVVCGSAGALVLAGVLFGPSAARAGVPRLPQDDGEVLEHVPSGTADARERKRGQLQALLAAHPDDLFLALNLSRLDIELSRARSDPRYLGYAQAALAPWWGLDAPPPAVRVLRATIRQSSHDFDGALRDLDAVVATEPDNAQAWITRSVVLTVRGQYDEAKASCAPLARLTPALVLAVCESSIDAVSGSAGPAYDRLESTLRTSPPLSPAEEAWAISTLGETALRLGRPVDAERAFKRVLALDPDDPYVLAAYADLLLDLRRPAEAAALTRGRTDNDGLLLRLALAETETGAPDAASHADLLGARFDASHQRGDVVHRREEARFVLSLRHDPAGALHLARANWDVQREPWDVRVLLEAALAAHSPDAAAPALAFLDAHHLQDPTIAAVAAKLRSPSR